RPACRPLKSRGSADKSRLTRMSCGATLTRTICEADLVKTPQAKMAEWFLARHRAPPALLLPNAWDAMSARLFVAAGFDALATTSGGVAWALGYPDGEKAPWAEVVAATARIVRATRVPVTADIEAGYGDSPAEVGLHVEQIIRAGVVGINLEDG